MRRCMPAPPEALFGKEDDANGRKLSFNVSFLCRSRQDYYEAHHRAPAASDSRHHALTSEERRSESRCVRFCFRLFVSFVFMFGVSIIFYPLCHCVWMIGNLHRLRIIDQK